MGKRIEEHLELLNQIENEKKSKKEASERNKEAKIEFEKGSLSYRQIVDEITSLGHTYNQVTLKLQNVTQTVIDHCTSLQI